MPLIKSSKDKARQENIETEIHEGRPIKQAVAIGYANQQEMERKEHDTNRYGRTLPY